MCIELAEVIVYAVDAHVVNLLGTKLTLGTLQELVCEFGAELCDSLAHLQAEGYEDNSVGIVQVVGLEQLYGLVQQNDFPLRILVGLELAHQDGVRLVL